MSAKTEQQQDDEEPRMQSRERRGEIESQIAKQSMRGASRRRLLIAHVDHGGPEQPA